MYEYADKELGKIIINPNVRAKNIIARRYSDHIKLTVPENFNTKRLPAILDDLRPKLLKIPAVETLRFNDDTKIESLTFTSRFVRSEIPVEPRVYLVGNELRVQIPNDFDLSNSFEQEIVKNMIIYALRFEARKVLSKKTKDFAKKHNLNIREIKINKSTSRWGSCSYNNNINLSLYLMLMPEKYIDYVILHELAHTIEKNHSPKFWKLLDSLCGEDSKAISSKVKRFDSPAYRLLK